MSRSRRRALPRAAVALGALLLAVVLVGVFVHREFPYDDLRERIEEEASRRTGARVTIEALAPRFDRSGLFLDARGVRIETGTDRVELDRVAIRPALDPTWLRGEPALRVELAHPWLRMGGVVTGGGRVRARVEGFALDRIPADLAWPGASLAGSAVGRVSLEPDGEAATIEIHFTGTDASLRTPETGIAVPFETLEARARWSPGHRIDVQALELAGPMLSLRAEGRVGPGPDPLAAPLRLTVDVDAAPAVARRFANAGLAVGADGTGRLQIGGTVDAPVVR